MGERWRLGVVEEMDSRLDWTVTGKGVKLIRLEP